MRSDGPLISCNGVSSTTVDLRRRAAGPLTVRWWRWEQRLDSSMTFRLDNASQAAARMTHARQFRRATGVSGPEALSPHGRTVGFTSITRCRPATVPRFAAHRVGCSQQTQLRRGERRNARGACRGDAGGELECRSYSGSNK